MGKRRVLVIGSQCDALGPGRRLSFLPKAAEDLYAVMTDPELGGCEPALAEGGLLLNPTASEARRRIKNAFEGASNDDATLFIAYIGHGDVGDTSPNKVSHDFYLLPRDAGWPPDSETGIHLVQWVKEMHRRYTHVDGFVILLDACYAGDAAVEAAEKWVAELNTSKGFEFLAAVADRTAADGCFTRNLVDILRNGIETIRDVRVGELVRCEHAKELLLGRCPKHEPQLPTHNARQELFLARNAVFLRNRPPWFDTSMTSEIMRLTAWLQPTGQLERLVEALDTHRCVALGGVAGTGKSTLAVALSRPEATAGKVPAAYVHGIVLLSEGMTSELFAEELAKQLESSVPDFASAAESFRRGTPAQEFSALDAFERRVAGPLRWLKPEGTLRLVVDGLDRLTTGTSQLVQKALTALTEDPVLSFVHLLVTGRPETYVPPRALPLTMDLAAPEDLRAYLLRRGINPGSHDAIVERAAGNWLVAQLLADLAADPAFEPAALPSSLTELYAEALLRAGATDTKQWREMLRPVLGVLAAAGVGPVLPLKLLAAASGRLEGPARPTPIHDVLFDMRGFVARSAPGTDQEQAGLFHQTLADYLLGPSAGPFGIDPQEPHAALAAAIDTLAPMARHNRRDPLHHYAEAREAEHLWAIGDYERALASLSVRNSVIPAENLMRHGSWHLRAQGDLGRDHPLTLAIRNDVAYWTGEAGDAREALRLSQELLPDRDRVLGPDHPRRS
jgi:hypothetical protein